MAVERRMVENAERGLASVRTEPFRNDDAGRFRAQFSPHGLNRARNERPKCGVLRRGADKSFVIEK
jgi:hypothetical protein